MINFNVYMYHLVGALYMSIMPMLLLLGLLWVIITILKKFVRSIIK